MARILIVGGGFGGMVAAEKLSVSLNSAHEITLVSPSRFFTFYPALVHLAFGDCDVEDIQFDMAAKLKNMRVNFLEGEMTAIVRNRSAIEFAGKDIRGELSYDYVVFAIGRRLATERVPGFYKHAHHLLTVDAALKFGHAVRNFSEGDIVLGACPGARLPVPLCEAAFELAKRFEKQVAAGVVRIKVLFPESVDEAFGGAQVHERFEEAFARHKINVIYDVPISKVTDEAVHSSEGHKIKYDLLMLVPPFSGNDRLANHGITDGDGYLLADGMMRVFGMENAFAVGDNVAFSGPKLAHMAARQAEVAASNVISLIIGEEPTAVYYHEVVTVVDAAGPDSIYLRYGVWDDQLFRLKKGRFWGLAKEMHDSLWQAQHS